MPHLAVGQIVRLLLNRWGASQADFGFVISVTHPLWNELVTVVTEVKQVLGEVFLDKEVVSTVWIAFFTFTAEPEPR